MKYNVLVIVGALLLIACKTPEQKLKNKLSDVIESYMQEPPNGIDVDSVCVYRVDSLTVLDFAYLYKLVLENAQNSIYENPILYLETPTKDETEELESFYQQLDFIKEKLRECDNILTNPSTDSVTVKYFFVASKIDGKDKSGQYMSVEMGFPISTDYKVVEMQINRKND